MSDILDRLDKAVETLEPLERAATPGPWMWQYEDASMLTLGRKGKFGIDYEHSVLWCTRCKSCRERDATRFPCGCPRKNNSSFIEAMRPSDNETHWTDLLRDAKREIERLRREHEADTDTAAQPDE